jgi:hypothetical protein
MNLMGVAHTDVARAAMYSGPLLHYDGFVRRRARIPNMALAAEDIEFIKGHLEEWLAEKRLAAAPQPVLERELLERVVRVEEELRHQRELMQQGFAAMEKRFEEINKRFEQVDKRFEQVEKRFEQVDRHLTELTRRMDRFMVWTFSLTVSAVAIIIAAMRFWGASP